MSARSVRRALSIASAAVAIGLVPLRGDAQAIHPEVKKEADALVARISAAALTADIKDSLNAQVKKALDPRLSTESQFRSLDAVGTQINNSVPVLKALEDFIAQVNATAEAPPGLKAYYIGLANSNRKFFPRHYIEVSTGTSRLKSQFENYPPLIGRIKAFAQVVADSKAPPIMKKHFADGLSALIAKMGPTALMGDHQALEQDKTRFANLMSLLDEIEAFRAQVNKEAPAAYPDFKTNTFKELDGYRVNVGNPVGATSRDNLEAFKREYRKHLAWVMTANQILTQTTNKGFVDKNSVSNALYRARLQLLMIHLVSYHSDQQDPNGLDQLKREVDIRDDKDRRP